MKLLSRVVAITALALGVATAAGAAPITEVEFNGTIVEVNGTIATAQAIPTSAFTTPVPPTVFGPPDFPDFGFPTATVMGTGGGIDVDFYSFIANGGSVYFDIDNPQKTFDTVVSLFDAAGTLIAFNDDSDPEDPGTGVAVSGDSFLGVFGLGAGAQTYYVAVSEFPNFPTSVLTGTDFPTLRRPDDAVGGSAVIGATPGDSTYTPLGGQLPSGNGTAPYTLHISVQNPGAQTVPEPVTLLLFGAGVTATALRKRRR